MSDRTGKPRWLRCACCNSNAGKFVQWHNQDDGYGLCARCADWIAERDARKPPEWRTDLINIYGHPGTHRAPGRHETAQQKAWAVVPRIPDMIGALALFAALASALWIGHGLGF